jgi:outer membrane protein insertion porin family
LWSLDDINGGDAGSDVVDDGLNWRSSIGVSLRVNTGIGPIRINLTHPLESEIYDRTETFQLSFERSF